MLEPAIIKLKRLTKQLLLVFIAYTLCRFLFIVFNRHLLQLDDFWVLVKIGIGGLRFDASAIMATNAIFIFLTFLPFSFTVLPIYQKIYSLLFLGLNGICILLNLIDIAYFPFIHKRTQADALRFLTGEKGNDFYRLLPGFIISYWYVFLLFFVVFFCFRFLYKKIEPRYQFVTVTPKRVLVSTLALILLLAASVIGIRGGFQTKPLNIIHASAMCDVANIPALINTPFSIIKTASQKGIDEVHYLPEYEIASLQYGIHKPSDSAFIKKNVVVIIVESLSRRFLSYFGGEVATPFLDSLFRESMVFTNGFANAKESIQGIPAVISSIPSWQTEPFIFSLYASNTITSLASLLGEKGYSTSFFHGGFNGTMGFDSYCNLAGFKNYYGRSEYNNEEDFDGKWGIWDEPFLQYAANKMDASTAPFFSCLFTLNTHEPFQLPKQHQQRFATPGHPIKSCVRYADYALQQFFNTVKKKKWFRNTVFVITADHTAPLPTDRPTSPLEDFKIPIVFFDPAGSIKGNNYTIAEQIDIMPTLLHLLKYDKPYFALGKNLLQPQLHYAIQYINGIYQYVDSNYCYRFNGETGLGLYSWLTDSMFTHNLYPRQKEGVKYCDTQLKKSIQLFNWSLIHNKMHFSKFLSKY